MSFFSFNIYLLCSFLLELLIFINYLRYIKKLKVYADLSCTSRSSVFSSFVRLGKKTNLSEHNVITINFTSLLVKFISPS